MPKKPAAPTCFAPAPDFIICPAGDRAHLREVFGLALMVARDAEKSRKEWAVADSDTAADEAYVLSGIMGNASSTCTVELYYCDEHNRPSVRFEFENAGQGYKVILPISENPSLMPAMLVGQVARACETLIKSMETLLPTASTPDCLGIDPVAWLEGLKALHSDNWCRYSCISDRQIALATPWTNIISAEVYPEPTTLAHFARQAPKGIVCSITYTQDTDGWTETTASITHLYDTLKFERDDKTVFAPELMTQEVLDALAPSQRIAGELTSLRLLAPLDHLTTCAEHLFIISGRQDRAWRPAGKRGDWSCDLRFYRTDGHFASTDPISGGYALRESLVDYKTLCGVTLMWDEAYYLYAEVPIEFSGDPEALFLAFASTVHRFMKATSLSLYDEDGGLCGSDVRPWLTALALDAARTSGPNVTMNKAIALPGPWTPCSCISKYEGAFPMHPETEAHFAAAGIRSGSAACVGEDGEDGDTFELIRHTAKLPLPWFRRATGPTALRAVQEAKQAGALPDHLL